MNLGIYIQVPFCQRKCTYCNFSTGVFERSLYAPYVQAVCRELSEHETLYRRAGLELPGTPNRAGVDTVYLGGGTPSLLDAAALCRIVDTVRQGFPCQLVEVTLEADPETVTREKVAGWRSAGINRISLGAQSFDDRELAAAGRIHRQQDILEALRHLRAAGFHNVSLDLIAGLAHQTRATWKESLARLVDLRPEHASIYLLEIDEGSRLGREALAGGLRYGAGALPNDDAQAAFYEHAQERLAQAGYEHYEISNWALPGLRSRHNSKYWRREPYLGFGAGAHSFNGRKRWANVRDPTLYIAAIAKGTFPGEQVLAVTPEQALEEELFLGLRQLEGIELARIEKKYHASLYRRVEGLRESGLVEFDGQRLRLMPSRLTVANEAFIRLLD
ncbi:MAG TPA: radical SAM family heme chaperone HemW [Candidatus Acidoferrales bacterium]|nr:radical SAM family heme chaperone HemW [Candidatus Acidoferrales bacterium]